MSYVSLFAGLATLLYSTYLFFYPQYAVTFERIAPPSPILTSWQKDLICSREKPTPLFLNFYGDLKDMKIVIIFGREKEIGRIVLYPAIKVEGEEINMSGYIVAKDGMLKSVYDLNADESTEYVKNMTLSLDEEKFLRICYDRAETPKFDT